jgi:microcin C transport system ATP-binding protein
MGKALLEISNLTVSARTDGSDALILKELSLTVNEGETLAIVGASGAGKSTVALSILRLLPPALRFKQGEIRFRGQNLLKLPEEKVRALRGNAIAFIPQDPMSALAPAVRIEGQFREILHSYRSYRTTELEQQISFWLNRVGFKDVARVRRAYPHELSGGMCQRVLLAMAFSCSPALLITDEATSMLDVAAGKEIFDLLVTLRREFNTAHCMITHDIDRTLQAADRIVVVEAGEVVEQFVPDAIDHKNPASRRLYRSRAKLSSSSPEQSMSESSELPDDLVLELKNVHVSYPQKSRWLRRSTTPMRVVEGISFGVRTKRITALVGDSGSGKTTLARAIAGLLLIDAGEIVFQGVAISKLSEKDFRKIRNRIQFVVQDTGSAFDPRLTIEESLSEGLIIHNLLGCIEARTKIESLLYEVNLNASILDRFPYECSGGERQRLNLVRALALEPALLICDEPTSALDSNHALRFMELIQKLCISHSLAALIISHDAQLVDKYATTVVRLPNKKYSANCPLSDIYKIS